MREILFRGKRVDNGEWCEGYLVKVRTLPFIFSDIKGSCCSVVCPTVGQFTGVYDRNGKKIFEGDVVKIQVAYDVGCYPHTETELRLVTFIGGVFSPLHKCESLEVVGNIHDNPELLGESK